MLTGEDRRMWRKTCTNDTLLAINHIWSGMGSNPALHGDMPAIYRLNHALPRLAILLILCLLCTSNLSVVCVLSRSLFKIFLIVSTHPR